ncbi:glycosyltransferase family 2 protein [Marivirga sp. S37H4]|uniref:Glycosyltransferase family 2 protein n=1 Tax=Marivirga aurantiaca TaxID=2802615 RepID=A0A934X098_9BACT|nr:glycosyltransferase family 2 protein [Marivirga aurantiaca]MBK6266528.1 glycosyltransferase family 2 protein [Marivirga aurantiaca]
MVFTLNNPKWINADLLKAHKVSDVSYQFINELKRRIHDSTSNEPKVSVCISAWNEELNIIRCLDSLSRSVTNIPFEVIVVNNNSTDKTQQILDELGVTNYFQAVQGCGVSRQLAQEKAKGEYILLADADCYYPRNWLDKMYQSLMKDNVAVVYSRHSFLGNKNIKRWQYFLYELGKDFIIELRNIKRPYLNTYGMSMGFRRTHGLKEGFVTKNIRGEDGRMCFDLMKYGKVKLVRSKKARVWTSDRNLEKDGSIMKAIQKRVLRELLRMRNYFSTPEPHDTKTSENTEKSSEEYKKTIKSKLKMNKK